MKKLAIFIISFFVLFCVYIFWETNRVVVVHDTITFKNIPDSFNGFRILHITDIHAKEFGKKQSRLLDKLKGEKIDLIVMTGDYVDRHQLDKDQVSPTIDLIKGLQSMFPHVPIYFVNGNEDVYDQNNRLISSMQQAGAIFLEASPLPFALTRGNDRIWIGTISYTEEEFNKLKITKNDFYIALTHYPWNANIEEKNQEFQHQYKVAIANGADPKQVKKIVYVDADLVFAGHTHGGQIRLPIIGAIYAPSVEQSGIDAALYESEYKNKSFIEKLRDEGFLPKYSKGLYWINGRALYISGGLGVGGDFPLLRFRFLNPPEVNIVELKKG